MSFLSALRNLFIESSHESIPEDAVLVDVRSPGEVSRGGILGALNIPLAEIAKKSTHLLPEKEKSTVVFCASGMRSASARRTLISLGYIKVINGGGISSLAKRIGGRIN